jgi:hypothetical protein
MKGDGVVTRGFVYFHGAPPDYEVDAEKPHAGLQAFSFNDLCWQRREDPSSMRRSAGYEHLPDEWQATPI